MELDTILRIVSAFGAVFGIAGTAYGVWHKHRLNRARVQLSGGDDTVWQTSKAQPPAGHGHILGTTHTRLITIANLKGGVGKTTLAVNLAAYFSIKHGMRVLIVDTDFQGSTTDMCLQAGIVAGTKSKTEKLLDPNPTGDTLAAAKLSIHSAIPNCDLVPALPPLSRAESEHLANWVLGKPDESDMRYRFFETLKRGDAFKASADDTGYDIVIFDTPPRLSAASINALACSTHIFIPTVLSRVSVETTPTFVAMLRRMKAGLNPSLKIGGVLLNMTKTFPHLNATEQGLLDRLRDKLAEFPGVAVLPADTYIPNKVMMARPDGIAYVNNELAGGVTAQEIIDRLGDTIKTEIGL